LLSFNFEEGVAMLEERVFDFTCRHAERIGNEKKLE
jgi:hypothetical protein